MHALNERENKLCGIGRYIFHVRYAIRSCRNLKLKKFNLKTRIRIMHRILALNIIRFFYISCEASLLFNRVGSSNALEANRGNADLLVYY